MTAITDLGDVTMAAIHLAAARLDANITRAEFVELLTNLVRVACAEAVDRALKDELAPIHRQARRAADGIPTAPSQEGAPSAAGWAASHTTSEPSQSPGVARSEVSRPYTADNGQETSLQRRTEEAVAADEASRAPSSPRIAEPAPSTPPQSPLSGTATDGAGASPASSAGTETSQSIAKGHLSDADIKRLNADYLVDAAANGNGTPRHWMQTKAELHGVTRKEIYDAVEPAMRELVASRQHTHSAQCWCRTKPSSVKNPHCKLLIDRRGRRDPLVTPPPRADRYKVTRMKGTYGGG